MDVRRRSGIHVADPGIPRVGHAGGLVHSDLILRASADRDPRRRAGNRSIRLPDDALQTRHLDHIRHDGGVGRQPVQQLDHLHRPQFVHSAGIGPLGGDRDFGRAWLPSGVPSSARWLSCCWRRGCAFCPWFPPSTPAKPARSFWASSWCCSCCSGPKDWSGGTDCEHSEHRSRRASRLGNGPDFQALRRRHGGRPAQYLHPSGGSDQHSRAQRLRKIHPGEPAERDGAPGQRNGNHRRGWPQGGEGLRDPRSWPDPHLPGSEAFRPD